MPRIYFDHAASTPVDPRVLRAMEPYFTEQFGNPGSLHSFGQEAIAAVDTSREAIGKLIGAQFREVIFTGSATEANNLALRGAVRQFKKTTQPARIIISSIEHESVLETAEALRAEGVEIVHLPVDKNGIVDLEILKKSLNENTVVVSIMCANNETGVIQPIKEIARIIADFKKEKNVHYPLLHTDAVQAFQHLDCAVGELGVDMMTLSAHKIYGPKGIGALYVRQLSAVAPIIAGGGQEFGLRSGTENVPLIVGFAKAAALAVELRKKESARIAKLSEDFWKGVQEIMPTAELNGPQGGKERLPNILDIYFPGHEAQDLLVRFDRAGLAASSGSACRSRAVESSYVIEEMGYPKSRARESIRFSFGRGNTQEQITEALKILQTSLESSPLAV